MKGENFSLFGCLKGPFVNIFCFGKGKLLFFVIKMLMVCAVRRRGNKWFVIPENLFVVQIKIIVSDFPGLVIFPK